MERKQFTFYDSFFKAVSRIRSKAARCDAYDAICAYALTGELPNLDKLPDAAAIAFELSRPNLDASRRKSEAGKSGGRPKQTESKPKANEKQTESNSKARENAKQVKEQVQDKDKEQMLNIPPTPLPGGSPALQKAFSNWLQYKREKRQDYKPTGLQSLVTKVQRAAETYGEQAVIDLIGECMANNWQGIIFDRLGGGRTQRPPSFNAPVPDSGAEQRVREDLERMRKYLRENCDDP